MKNFYEWYLDRFKEPVPSGDLSGEWFAEKHLPMVVACTCCDKTMVPLCAMIDEFGQVYCTDCVRRS